MHANERNKNFELRRLYDVLDLVHVHVRLRRKLGRDGLGTFAAFRMLLAKIGAKICCCSQVASHASVGKIRR
jgi:hypothetical protein